MRHVYRVPISTAFSTDVISFHVSILMSYLPGSNERMGYYLKSRRCIEELASKKMLSIIGVSIVFFAPLATEILGLAVPRNEPSGSDSSDLRDIAEEYVAELTLQNKAIENLENQFAFGDEGSAETVMKVSDELIESYYRQMEPRNRMIEITSTDSVLDVNSIEYLVAVASRYADNVMHFAREIRSKPMDKERPALALKHLKTEHKKAMMFDQILLGLANVAMTDASSETSSISQKKGNTSGDESVDLSTADVTLSEDELPEENSQKQHSVVVEEEIQTTTTETTVTSYKETTIAW